MKINSEYIMHACADLGYYFSISSYTQYYNIMWDEISADIISHHKGKSGITAAPLRCVCVLFYILCGANMASVLFIFDEIYNMYS